MNDRSWNRDWSTPGEGSNSSTDLRSRSLATPRPRMVAASSSLDLPGVAVRKTRPGATRVPGVEPRSRQLRMLPKSDSPFLAFLSIFGCASTSEPDDARGRDRRRGVDLATRDAAMDDESTALMSASRSRRAGRAEPTVDRQKWAPDSTTPKSWRFDDDSREASYFYQQGECNNGTLPRHECALSVRVTSWSHRSLCSTSSCNRLLMLLSWLAR